MGLFLQERKEMQDKISVFFDTNLFLYLGLTPKNESDKQKQKMSINLFHKLDYDIFISNQVINEISNVLLKKSSFTKIQIIDFLNNIIDAVNICPLSFDITLNGIEIHDLYKFSFYDSLIIASALASGCSQLITEDLQDNQIIHYQYRQLKIINPFIKV